MDEDSGVEEGCVEGGSSVVLGSALVGGREGSLSTKIISGEILSDG